jgi:hypothetical protein
MNRRAQCSCGQLSVICEGEPVRRSMCHCLECQRRTGSAFGVQARFPLSAVTITGKSTEYARKGDSGGTAIMHFCPVCGSTVYWGLDSIAGFVSVAVGAFADPTFPPPTVSVYGERAHSWMAIPPTVEKLE